jgi:hypothetical protein
LDASSAVQSKDFCQLTIVGCCDADSIAPLKESMPCDAFTDLYWCLHFADDFEENEEQSGIFFDKKHVSPESAHHWQDFSKVEDAINRQLKEWVMVGVGLTHHKSRIAGWYKSEITCGPELKPIWTGVTLHSLAVGDGPLARYMHACLAGRTTAIWGCSMKTAVQFRSGSILCPS